MTPAQSAKRELLSEDTPAIQALAAGMAYLPPEQAAQILAKHDDASAATALTLLPPAMAIDILWELPAERRNGLIAAAPEQKGAQWQIDHEYPDGTVGRLMERPLAVFRLGTTVAEATARLRELVRRAHIVYGFVTDDDNRLRGVFAFRELLFAEPGATLDSLMVENPFALRAEMKVIDAVRESLAIHVPAYPVVDVAGRLIGMVRGRTLFAEEAFEISAQAQRLVGVDGEERLATRWPRSLKFRHPWLQLNLLTAFLAAAVVGFFQDTIDRLVVLAMFLPVLAGQSGNTGCQALAVTLRGMTLGELKAGGTGRLLGKEAILGLMNGLLVGIVAGGGMVVVATMQKNPAAWTLGVVVAIAMVGACVISGVSGAIIPLTLKRMGADPATASSIFLTTATDIASMGMLLGLATLFVR
jgi:magnesium transporter